MSRFPLPPRRRSRSPTNTFDRRPSMPLGQSQDHRDLSGGPRSASYGNHMDSFQPRDRDNFNRRPRSPSPPFRPNRDTRPGPRPSLDNSQARRPSRPDHGFSKTVYTDAHLDGPTTFRGGFSQRGRGRGRDDFRDRPRQFDRRSPPPRWGSRDDGPLGHPENRSLGSTQDRDDRSRRDPPPSRLDTRRSFHPARPMNSQHSPAINQDSFRDQKRRSSPTSISRKPSNQEPQSATSELPSSHPSTASGRFSRDPSPPHPPSVPAFGSFSFVPPKPAPPPVHHSRLSLLKDPLALPVDSENGRIPNQRSEAFLSQPPQRSPSPVMTTPAVVADMPIQAPKSPQAANVPTGPAALRRSRSSDHPQRPVDSVEPASKMRQTSPAITRSRSPRLETFQRPQTSTPPPGAPTGPRAMATSTSPRGQPPTGPRAERLSIGTRHPSFSRPGDMPPPLSTRTSAPQGRSRPWNQWISPSLQNATPVVSLKRSLSAGKEETPPWVINAAKTSSEHGDHAVTDDSKTMPQRVESSPHDTAVAAPAKSSADLEESHKTESIDQNTVMNDKIEDDLESILGDSDDDAMDLDEDDFEATRMRFEQQHARLRAQLADLSDHKFRVTEPFARLMQLSCVNSSHLPSPAQPDLQIESQEVDMTDSVETEKELNRKLLTPKAETAEVVNVKRRKSSTRTKTETEELIELPYLAMHPSIVQTLGTTPALDEKNTDLLIQEMHTHHEDQVAQQQSLNDTYAQAYRRFALLSRELDEQRKAKDEIELQSAVEPASENNDIGPLSAETPTIESSRRMHKFSSEYDIQKVLRESEETARLEQEKLEKASKRAKDDLEKEAIVPVLYRPDMIVQRVFVDRNTLRDVTCLTDVYGFHPPADDFTEDEHRVFMLAFKERPKKWGEISALLPDRTYQDCIHHYYAHKWDGRFRENKGKRKSKMGRGRGGKVATRVRGAALMADLSRPDDDPPEVGQNADSTAPSTGRPKRAAASRVANQDKDKDVKDTESAMPSTKTTPNKRALSRTDTGEQGNDKDKTGKQRRKKDQIGKPTRKVRGQAATAPGTAISSPQKRDVQPVSDPAVARTGSMQPPDGRMILEDEFVGDAHNMTDRAAQAGLQKSAASSYWSVPEQQDFLKFLGYFGMDFAAIATQMGTKTQTMVKNYYQRSVDSGNRAEFEAYARAGNERRQRGERMGSPPDPTPIIKRRYDNPMAQTSIDAPRDDQMDLDMSETLVQQPETRYVPTGPEAARGPVFAAPVQSGYEPMESNSRHVPANTSQSRHKVGYFRGEGRPVPGLEQHQTHSTHPYDRQETAQRAAYHEQRSTISPMQSNRQPDNRESGSQWFQELVREQSRVTAMQRDREAYEHEPYRGGARPSAPLHPQYAESRPTSATTTHMPEYRGYVKQEDVYPPPAYLASARHGPNVSRNVLGPPDMPASASVTSQDTRVDRGYGSTALLSRPSSVPTPSSALVPPPSSITDRPPKRKSNLADLLNSDEDPKPKRSTGPTSSNITQASYPSSRPRSPPRPPSRNLSQRAPYIPSTRQDAYGAPMSGRPSMDRPPTAVSTPLAPPEARNWSNAPVNQSREDWSRRQSEAPTYASGPRSPGPVSKNHERAMYPDRASMSNPVDARMRPASEARRPAPAQGAAQGLVQGHSRTSSYSATPIEDRAVRSRPTSQSYQYAPSRVEAAPSQVPYDRQPQSQTQYRQSQDTYARTREQQPEYSRQGYYEPPRTQDYRDQARFSRDPPSIPPTPVYRDAHAPPPPQNLRDMSAAEGMAQYNSARDYAQGSRQQTRDPRASQPSVQRSEPMDDRAERDYARRNSEATWRRGSVSYPQGEPDQRRLQDDYRGRDGHAQAPSGGAGTAGYPASKGYAVPGAGYVTQQPPPVPLPPGYRPSEHRRR